MTENPTERITQNFKMWAAFFGVGATALYIVGYIAERIFWSVLGHARAPVNHLEFLYRGGNVAISFLAEAVQYAIDLVTSVDVNVAAAWLLVIAIIAFTMRAWTLRFAQWYALVSIIIPIAVMLISLIKFWELPNVGTVGSVEATPGFFRRFVGFSVWIFFLCYLCWRSKGLIPGGSEKLGRYARFVSLLAALFLAVLLPAVYGTYRYPTMFPAGQVVLAENAPAALKEIVENKELVFLYEDDAVLTCMVLDHDSPTLQIDRSQVMATYANTFVDLRKFRGQIATEVNDKVLYAQLNKATAPSALLAFLGELSEIRSVGFAALEPYGTVLSNKIVFSWRCTEKTDHFILRILKNSLGIDEEEIQKLRLDGSVRSCFIDIPEVEGSSQYTWILERYAAPDGFLTAKVKERFRTAKQDERERIEKIANEITGLLQSHPSERHLVLLQSMHYAKSRAYGMARHHVGEFLGLSTEQRTDYSGLMWQLRQKSQDFSKQRDDSSQAFLLAKSVEEQTKALSAIIEADCNLLDYEHALVVLGVLQQLGLDKFRSTWVVEKTKLLQAAKAVSEQIFRKPNT